MPQMRVTHTANHLGNVTPQEMLAELVKTGSWEFSRDEKRGMETPCHKLCKSMFLRNCLQNILKAIVKRDQLVLSKQLLVTEWIWLDLFTCKDGWRHFHTFHTWMLWVMYTSYRYSNKHANICMVKKQTTSTPCKWSILWGNALT